MHTNLLCANNKLVIDVCYESTSPRNRLSDSLDRIVLPSVNITKSSLKQSAEGTIRLKLLLTSTLTRTFFFLKVTKRISSLNSRKIDDLFVTNSSKLTYIFNDLCRRVTKLLQFFDGIDDLRGHFYFRSRVHRQDNLPFNSFLKQTRRGELRHP